MVERWACMRARQGVVKWLTGSVAMSAGALSLFPIPNANLGTDGMFWVRSAVPV